MRIGVISDTHGDQAALRQAAERVTNVDLWLHAGDCSQDTAWLTALVAVPVIAARGNCDGHVAAKIDEFIDVADKKVWITHGHRYNVKYGTQELVQCGARYGADIVIYGHTHIVDQRWCEGMFIFNPGSAYGSRGTCGVLDIGDDGQIAGSIIVLNA